MSVWDNIKFKYRHFYSIILLFYLVTLYVDSELQQFAELLFYLVFFFYFLKTSKRPTKFIIWSLLIILVSAASIQWSFDSRQSEIMTRGLLSIALTSNLLIGYIDNQSKITELYKMFVLGGVALLIRLLTIIPPSQWLSSRLGSVEFGLNSNVVGIFLTFSAIFSFYLAKYNNSKKNYFLVLIFLFSIFLTGSRKAIFMVISGIVGILYFNTKGLSSKVRVTFSIIFLMFVVYFMLMNIPTLYQIAGQRIEILINSIIGTGTGDISTNIRGNMVEKGISLLKERPLIGYGIGSYTKVANYGTYSHNNYIELLVGVGILGTFTYYSMYIYLIKKLFKYKGNPSVSPLLVIVILMTIIDYGFVSYYTVLYHLLLAISYSVIKLQE